MGEKGQTVNTGNCCKKCNGCLFLCLERGDSGVMKKKMCFSKKLLIADYVILLLLAALFFVPGAKLSMVHILMGLI